MSEYNRRLSPEEYLALERQSEVRPLRTIEPLAEVVFISQEDVEVERFSRQPEGGWLLLEASRLEDSLPLPSIGNSSPVPVFS